MFGLRHQEPSFQRIAILKFRAPSVHKMNRQPPGGDQHHVKAHVEPVQPGARLHEGHGGANNTGGLSGEEGFPGLDLVLAGLDLYENKHPTAPGDNVDFADMCPKPPFDDPVAPEA